MMTVPGRHYPTVTTLLTPAETSNSEKQNWQL